MSESDFEILQDWLTDIFTKLGRCANISPRQSVVIMLLPAEDEGSSVETKYFTLAPLAGRAARDPAAEVGQLASATLYSVRCEVMLGVLRRWCGRLGSCSG